MILLQDEKEREALLMSTLLLISEDYMCLKNKTKQLSVSPEHFYDAFIFLHYSFPFSDSMV